MRAIRRWVIVAAGLVMAASMTVPISATAQARADQSGLRAVMIAGSDRLPSGDRAIAARVEAAGFELVVVDDDDSADTDLDGADLLLIASSVVPGKVGDTFKGASVPMLVWEPYLYDALGLATTATETTRKRTFITIVDELAPGSGVGLGNVAVYTSAQAFSSGLPGAEAQVIAHEFNNPDSAVIFGYERGDRLADGAIAPEARLALFPTFAGGRVLTGNGERLVDAAILRLTGVGATVSTLDPSWGAGISVALDADGHPVIAYRRATPVQDLVVIHCNDARCLGGDESIEVVDAAGSVGFGASMALDADGHPVISYFDSTLDAVKLVHCNDPNCAGGDESIVPVVPTSRAITETSLALDAAGNPVFSFFDRIPDPNPFYVVHCNDPNCVGGDESIEMLAGPEVGFRPTLRLDAVGHPVISYFDGDEFDLELVHCNDPYCAGDDESSEVVDSAGKVGSDSSMVLSPAGNPVISYHDSTRRQIELVLCNDPDCAGGDERVVALARTRSHVWGTSVGLTGSGLPVVAHASGRKPDLLVTRCSSVDCSDTTTVTIDGGRHVGFGPALVVGDGGSLTIAYGEGTKDFFVTALKLARTGP